VGWARKSSFFIGDTISYPGLRGQEQPQSLMAACAIFRLAALRKSSLRGFQSDLLQIISILRITMEINDESNPRTSSNSRTQWQQGLPVYGSLQPLQPEQPLEKCKCKNSFRKLAVKR
jgi:hypothetical protein